MYYNHRYNLIRFDLGTSGTAYKLFVKALYDYVIVKEVTVSDVTVRSYFVGAKSLETNWSNRASLTYSTDIKGRKLVNEGQNWLAAAIGQITELLTGVNYRVEDYPLVWIEDTYYTTYKDDIFQVSAKTDIPTQAEYDAVTTINLSNQSLTTHFNFLNKFNNLTYLSLSQNPDITLEDNFDKSNMTFLGLNFCSNVNINIDNADNLERVYMLNVPVGNVDFTYKTKLIEVNFQNTNATLADLSNCVLLEILNYAVNSLTSIDLDNLVLLYEIKLQGNSLTDLSIVNNLLLIDLRCQNNQLDNIVNSQILIDLDTNGLSNGYLQSSIFGGGSLTAAGQTAKSNLQAKGWSIIGI